MPDSSTFARPVSVVALGAVLFASLPAAAKPQVRRGQAARQTQAAVTRVEGKIDKQALKIRALEKKLADLEKKLAALEQKHAGHTHDYQLPPHPPFGWIQKAGFDNLTSDALIPFVSQGNVGKGGGTKKKTSPPK